MHVPVFCIIQIQAMPSWINKKYFIREGRFSYHSVWYLPVSFSLFWIFTYICYTPNLLFTNNHFFCTLNSSSWCPLTSLCFLLFAPVLSIQRCHRNVVTAIWPWQSEGILLYPLCASTSSCHRPPNSKLSNLIISNLGTVKDERIQSKNKLRFKNCFQLLCIFVTKTPTLPFRD